MPKASTGVSICGENIFKVSTDFIVPSMVLKQMISSLGWEVLAISAGWGAARNADAWGWAKGIKFVFLSFQPFDGEGVG